MRARRLALTFTVAAFCAAPAVQATITEQRERLPPPAECDDSVEGIWKAHRHNPDRYDWRIFVLTIRRVPGSKNGLHGTITNEAWPGGPAQELPGPCRGQYHWIVSMDGQGTIEGQVVRFGGVGQWRLDATPCGHGPGGYNLDNFSGTIDAGLQEFQSVNNDGGRAVNEPTVFRRIRCFPPGSTPHIEVTPPPIFPSRPRGC